MWWRGPYGPWPGHGPWSHLPPWMRPGWYLWWAAPQTAAPVAPWSREAELQYLESLKSYLQETLRRVEERINELKSSK
ncbi:hypothetical protein WLZ34_07105 [Thermogladius sp. KZ2Tp1]|uniref:hypothetical protein n=1 Tax=Thermogladius sp. KZ2Tp1 TaxID=3136289 RepID=UPI003DAA1165